MDHYNRPAKFRPNIAREAVKHIADTSATRQTASPAIGECSQ